MIGREESLREYRDRVTRFSFLGLLAFAAIAFRLFYLQILKGDELRQFSDRNHLKKEVVLAPRGRILDRNGKVIVDNRASLDVVLTPQYLNDDDRTYQFISERLGVTRTEIEKKIRNRAASSNLVIKDDVDKDMVAAVEMEMDGLPGLAIEPSIHRSYPFGALSGQVLGYLSEAENSQGELTGKMGIEKAYDASLKGTNGAGYIEVDSRGRRHKPEEGDPFGFVNEVNPVPGQDLKLTLDMELEKVAEHALTSRGFTGTVVAIEPSSGEILAMVNAPSFNPEALSSRRISNRLWNDLLQDEGRPLRNRAIQDVYPPGSTFKPFLALAALAEGISPKDGLDCAGGVRFGKRLFHCWHPHGRVDMLRAIQVSCDTYFYQLGIRLGVDAIYKYASLFNFGKKSGVELSGEQVGLIPNSEWKKSVYHEAWQAGETLSIAIGQGYVSVTPLQLALAYATLANGGNLYQPHLIASQKPKLMLKLPVPKEALDLVREGLHRTVNSPGGTGYHSTRSERVDISGKTGTAQVRGFANMATVNCATLPKAIRHHAWFAGYAPSIHPKIALAILVEHGCHGAASPIAKEIIEAYFSKDSIVHETVKPEPTPDFVAFDEEG